METTSRSVRPWCSFAGDTTLMFQPCLLGGSAAQINIGHSVFQLPCALLYADDVDMFTYGGKKMSN